MESRFNVCLCFVQQGYCAYLNASPIPPFPLHFFPHTEILYDDGGDMEGTFMQAPPTPSPSLLATPTSAIDTNEHGGLLYDRHATVDVTVDANDWKLPPPSAPIPMEAPYDMFETRALPLPFKPPPQSKMSDFSGASEFNLSRLAESHPPGGSEDDAGRHSWLRRAQRKEDVLEGHLAHFEYGRFWNPEGLHQGIASVTRMHGSGYHW